MQQAGAKETALGILEELDYGIIVLDGRGIIRNVNALAASVLGVKAENITGRQYISLGQSFFEIADQALNQGVFLKEPDMLFKRPDGRTRYLSCSAHQIKDPQKGECVLIAFRDDTVLVEREFAAEKAQRLAAIGTMVASVAHDIKNPLVALKTFAELFPSKYNEADFRESFTKVVIGEIKRIDELVCRLLDFANPKRPVMESVDIDRVISDTLDLFSLKMSQQKITVRNTNVKRLPEIKADGGQIRRVFNNLVLNAIEAMPRGGTLTLTTDLKQQRDRISGGCSDYAEISVADSGHGISEKEINRIFDSFYTTKKNGSGLGLSICRKIVESHNGTIKVESSSRGTVFTVRLPVKKNDVSSSVAGPLNDGIRKIFFENPAQYSAEKVTR